MWEKLHELLKMENKPVNMRLAYMGDYLKVFLIYLTGIREYKVTDTEITQIYPVVGFKSK